MAAPAPAAPRARIAGSVLGPVDAASDIVCATVVLGAKSWHYAAFRSADLGIDTVLIERYASLGGVCSTSAASRQALLPPGRRDRPGGACQRLRRRFGAPKINIDTLRGYKEKVVGQLWACPAWPAAQGARGPGHCEIPVRERTRDRRR